jgi:hypothetical protein
MICHVFANTNQSATNQFNTKLLNFIEVEVQMMKHVFTPKPWVCIANGCQQGFNFKGGMENTSFRVNKDALFLIFYSTAEGHFRRQPVC